MRLSNKKTFETSKGKLEITIEQLGGLQAGRLSVRLGKIVGPSLARLAGGAKDAKSIEASAFSGAASDLFERLSEDEFQYLVEKLLDGAEGNTGKEFVDVGAQVDDLFRGHVADLYSLLQFALEVNFSDFFDGLTAAYKAAMAKEAASSPATNTSSGQLNA